MLSSSKTLPEGPPPEAFTVCATAALNDTCSVETPRGTLASICKSDRRGERLLCVPEGMKKRHLPRGRRSEQPEKFPQDSNSTPESPEKE